MKVFMFLNMRVRERCYIAVNLNLDYMGSDLPWKRLTLLGG